MNECRLFLSVYGLFSRKMAEGNKKVVGKGYRYRFIHYLCTLKRLTIK